MPTAHEEKELFKFVTDPIYREKAINRTRKEQDERYWSNVKCAEAEVTQLMQARNSEINRITTGRWENAANGKLWVNRTEGKIRTDEFVASFSSIKGAQINCQQGYKIITTDNSKSKKHVSVGGAHVGGALLGPVGAVAGGVGLGKTKTKGQSVTNQIPMCTHLGVSVNIDGFVSEIVLLDREVLQASAYFRQAYSLAQQIVGQLGTLAKVPVPTHYLRPEEEISVKIIDEQIEAKQKQLQAIAANRPTYKLPLMYRTEEQKSMTDGEYLTYLKENDNRRQSELAQNQTFKKQQQAQYKELKRKERRERLAGFKDKSKRASIAVDILFWGASVIMLLLALVGFATDGMEASGMIFLLTAVFVNPLVYKELNKKKASYKRWVCLVILLGGFFLGIMMMPTDEALNNEDVTMPSTNVETSADTNISSNINDDISTQ